MSSHTIFMQRALDLALQGFGEVAPNPMVGSVIVYDGKIIGEGFHERYGGPHAEVNAIASVKNKEQLRRSTLYVNLEPCSHHGKTPPCVDLIIHQGIPQVVVACMDSNTLVKGRGIEKLIRAGVHVTLGIMEEAGREINRRFFTFHEQKRPYIILKWAQTADGFIAPAVQPGEEPQIYWITTQESRNLVHQWRRQEQSILVGTNTVKRDNPRLTVRGVEGKQPLRVIIDRQLSIPANYHVLDRHTPTLIITEKTGVSSINLDFVQISFDDNFLTSLLDILCKRNIQSLIVEGGTHTLQSFIDKNLWDEARVFTSPKCLNDGVKAPVLRAEHRKDLQRIGPDELIIYYHSRA